MRLSVKNPMRVVLLTVLLSEVLVFALAIPVMVLVSDVPAGRASLFAGGAAVLALVAAGLMRRPAGYPLGWLTQLLAVGLGLLTASMYVVGALFLVIWFVTFLLGRRLDEMAASRAEAGPGPDKVTP
ncbi:DUF4233 domain-containing protein [uncultured Friedmanniella sp.]|uniref:DUF4233 domain-containing protein n=1 Tax=uncultured Friedmanniella sp. TaxID=335381 RepID=UPI0035C95F63